MVNFYRLIFSLLAVLASASSFAFGAYEFYSPNGYTIAGQKFPSAGALCSAISAAIVANDTSGNNVYGVESVSDTECVINRSYKGNPKVFTAYTVVKSGAACPTGSTGTSPNCSCTAPLIEVNGSCEAKNEDRDQCSAWGAIGGISGGALVQDYRLQGNVSDGAQYCMQGAFDSPAKGCKVSFRREAFLDYGGSNSITEGTFSIAGNASSVDQSCVVGDQNTPPKVPPVEKCKGGFTGTVNGVEVCINKVPDSGVDGDKKDKVEETDTEKKTTKTDRNTDCKNGVCTTVTTTTVTTVNKTNGSSTTSSSSTTTSEKQDGFCNENPTSKLCADDPASKFGGSCKGGFKCEGDAIQCAIAQDQHKRACQAFDDESPESKLYADNKGKTGNQTGDLPGNETINVAGRIDSTDALGAGSAGVSDLNVTVWGQSITLPFSMINPYLEYMGYLLVAVSFLLAFRIVARG